MTLTLVKGPLLEAFSSFCEQNWQSSITLVEQAHEMQRNRDKNDRDTSKGR